MSRIYAIWNYRTGEVEFPPELPSNYADYISPNSMARYEQCIAQGDAPIEAAMRVWSGHVAAHEQDAATLRQIEAGRKRGEALGAIRPVVPPQPRPKVTNGTEMIDSGCLFVAMILIGLSALVLAAILSLNAAWPWLMRVGLQVEGWAQGHQAVVGAALVLVALVSFSLARRARRTE